MTPLVVIPARNEAGRVGRVVEQARACGYAVVVINDGSSDATGAEARAAGARVVTHHFSLGYGATVETGFHFALDNGYDTVVTLDGDGQHDPADIDKLLAALAKESADVVLGSRELGRRAGLPVETPEPLRHLGQSVLRRIASALAGRALTDPTTGFLAVGPRALRFLSEGRYPHDYPDADVLVMLARSGLVIAEAPIAVHPRRGGRSMHSGLKPLYYMMKMSLSLILTPLRRERAP